MCAPLIDAALSARSKRRPSLLPPAVRRARLPPHASLLPPLPAAPEYLGAADNGSAVFTFSSNSLTVQVPGASSFTTVCPSTVFVSGSPLTLFLQFYGFSTTPQPFGCITLLPNGTSATLGSSPGLTCLGTFATTAWSAGAAPPTCPPSAAVPISVQGVAYDGVNLQTLILEADLVASGAANGSMPGYSFSNACISAGRVVNGTLDASVNTAELLTISSVPGNFPTYSCLEVVVAGNEVAPTSFGLNMTTSVNTTAGVVRFISHSKCGGTNCLCAAAHPPHPPTSGW